MDKQELREKKDSHLEFPSEVSRLQEMIPKLFRVEKLGRVTKYQDAE